MNCEDARLELVGFIRRELSEEVEAAVAAHVRECDRCSHEVMELRDTSSILGEAGLVAEVPGGMKATTMAHVEASGITHLMQTAIGPRPPRDLKQRAFERVATATAVVRRGVRPVVAWSLAAAASVAAVVALASALQVREANDDLADQREQVNLARQQLGPIGHPMQFFELVGRDSRAEAELVHFRHDNFRVVLETARFNSTPTGYHYAVWLRGKAGAVSLGSFRLVHPDDLTLSFTTGVDPGDYPEVLITLERNDGDPEIAGRVVARATLARDDIYHGPYDE